MNLQKRSKGTLNIYNAAKHSVQIVSEMRAQID